MPRPWERWWGQPVREFCTVTRITTQLNNGKHRNGRHSPQATHCDTHRSKNRGPTEISRGKRAPTSLCAHSFPGAHASIFLDSSWFDRSSPWPR